MSRALRYAWHSRRLLSTSAASASDVPVAIVGAGPTGLTLSWHLSRYGAPSLEPLPRLPAPCAPDGPVGGAP
jgi:NADH dehydrogenase FAD-containing subunit